MVEAQLNEKPVPSLLTTLLERLDEQDENLELEYKLAQNGLPNNIWETVSAFANTKGGWIILGVKENPDGFEIIGLPDPNSLLNNFYSTSRNANKLSFPSCGADDTKIEDLDGSKLIVIRIPAAPRKNRPVFTNNNPYTGTFVRRNSGDYHCNKQEVDRMMRDASTDSAASTILDKFSLDDLDLEALARYRQRFRVAQPGSPYLGLDDKEFLRRITGYGKNRDNGLEGVTVAGLLMFGKISSLCEWRIRHLIDYRLVPQNEEIDDRRWDDRVAWEGCLFEAYEKIYPRLIASQPVPFKLVSGTRDDDPPSHIALREALVNLLVHADYAESDASLIIQSPGGYSFRNPGSSRILESDLLTGNRSDPRNPELVRMFRFIGACDEGGTGIPKIIRAWRTLGFKLPLIDVGTERYEFSLKLRHSHLLSEDDRSWLKGLGENWSESEQLTLVLARHEEEVDNFKVRQLTDQHAADVTKMLGGLKDRGLLEMISGGRGARYKLGNFANNDLLFTPFDSSEQINAKQRQSVMDENIASRNTNNSSYDTNLVFSPESGDSYAKDDSPYAKDADSYAKDADSYANNSLVYKQLKIDDEVSKRLEEIFAPFRGRRISKLEIREKTIQNALKLVPLSLRQLIELTGLKEPHLRVLLQSMALDNKIVFLYPKQPSHPKQKYCDPKMLLNEPVDFQ